MEAELLILALDGAIVDVSQSVPSAVRRTVQEYFSRYLGVRGSGSLVSEADAEAFRQAGLTDPALRSAALIAYLLSLMPSSFPRSREPNDIRQATHFLERAAQKGEVVSAETLQQRADFAGMAAQIRAAGGGGAGVARAMPKAWNHPLLFHQGGPEKSNVVARLYREIYLGRKNFARLEGDQQKLYRGPGQMEAESLAVSRERLERLRGALRGRIGAITERTAAETTLLLQSLALDTLLDALVVREDRLSEEARLQRRGEGSSAAPPHPFMLLEAADRLDYGGTRPALYLGTTPDEMAAAQAASAVGPRPFTAWAIVPPGRARDAFIAAGAARLFEVADDAFAALLPS